MVMDELIVRLKRNPALSAELVLASVCTNVLALADTIFVMIVLRRYIAYGFDGTLIILTAGTLVALGLQWGVRRSRDILAADVSRDFDKTLSEDMATALVDSDAMALQELPPERVRGAVVDFQTTQSAYDALNIGALLDAPFALMFTASVFFLSPLLSLIVLIGVAISLGAGLASVHLARRGGADLADESGRHHAMVGTATRAADTVRVFGGAEYCHKQWTAQVGRIGVLRNVLEDTRGLSQSVTLGAGVFVRVAIYSVGAKLAVEGELSVAALIGASILGSYAIQKATACANAYSLLEQAREAMRRIGELTGLPGERHAGAIPETYEGALELAGMSYAFPNGSPLFQGLDLALAPGEVLAVQGANGSGKSTLMRLVAGLAAPQAGRVLADGRDLRELNPKWWRKQLAYVPQEPFFLAGSFRENLTVGNPEIEERELRRIINASGLVRFIDLSDKGLESPMIDAGRTLPVGIRKRMALARALCGGGRLLLLDEPTEGLDAEGTAMVYKAMNDLAQGGATIIVISHDPAIVKGAHQILDLGVGEGHVLRPGGRAISQEQVAR
ncbi:ATP-binding cassette domain-containing protein [Desulfovibrio ferrophilus]|uniref:ABC transporter related protein n=1 Tax=Desulfovibrio ferrophilus TaxID=241368 RepID=A0A2Z6AUU0_9BACT|nr:ATP-binding cassette domain-containing protein [Desulfovibrio ferrophilus]BBD07012.1 ABC transporter related protein [Desulfovibrio ferrophilus]